MYSSDFVVTPRTLEEAYSAYQSVGSSVLVAGAWGLKNYDSRHYALAIDLSHLGLDYIREEGEDIHIGAMTTIDMLQRSPVLQSFAGGALVSCAKEIKNTAMKRHVTLGGILAGKSAFSRILPLLLTLQVDVALHDKGRMALDNYLYCPPLGEFITEISIAREDIYAVQAVLMKEGLETPYLTGAVSMRDESWRIVLGGRPELAAVAANASKLLSRKGMAVRDNAAHLASEELDFATDAVCTEQERRMQAADLVRDLVNRTWKGFNRMMSKSGKKH